MSEQSDLEALLTHPGYLHLVTFAKQQWDDGMGIHLASAADDRDDLMALQKLRQVIAAQRAVRRLLAWPAERIATLAHGQALAATPASPSRRGPL